MTDTVKKALSPFYIANGILGTWLFEYSKWYLNWIYMAIVWIFYISLLYAGFQSNYKGRVFLELTAAVHTLIHPMCVMFTVGVNIYCRKKFQICLNTLVVAGEILSNMGIPDDYRKINKRNKGILILCLTMYLSLPLLSCCTNVLVYQLKPMLIIVLLNQYSMFMINTNNCLIWALLKCTESEFDRLNKCIERLTLRKETQGKWFLKKAYFQPERSDGINEEEDTRQIWILMNLHLKLTNMSRRLNEAFQTQICFQMMVHFTHIIQQVSVLYQMITNTALSWKEKSLLVIVRSLVCTVDATKLIVISAACETVQEKSLATAGFISKFLNFAHISERWTEIKQFILQVQQRPLRFTAMGFFSFGTNSMFSLYAIIAEIVIFMWQTNSMASVTLPRSVFRHQTEEPPLH